MIPLPQDGAVATKYAVVLRRELRKLVRRDVNRAQDASESSAIERVMKWNDHGCTPWTREAHMAAFLPNSQVAELC